MNCALVETPYLEMLKMIVTVREFTTPIHSSITLVSLQYNPCLITASIACSTVLFVLQVTIAVERRLGTKLVEPH